MNILITALAIIAAYLIGRYYKSVKAKELKSANDKADYLEGKYNDLWLEKSDLHLKYQVAIKQRAIEKDRADNNYAELQSERLKQHPVVDVVKNIAPHHAADTEYIGIYPTNGLEPAHITREAYQLGVKRLKDNPEDNIKTNKK